MLTILEFSHDERRYRARLVESTPHGSWWHVGIDEVEPLPVLIACLEDETDDVELEKRLVDAVEKAERGPRRQPTPRSIRPG